jgi:hypothetical protein
MAACYLSGLRDALRHWPLVLVLFAVHVLAGTIFTAAGWSWLSIALDRSLATRSLLTNLDTNLLVDLFVHHAESFRMLVLVGGALAAAFLVLGVWLNASTVAVVGEDLRLGDALHRGLSLFPCFLRLWLVATAVNVAIIIGACVLGRVSVRWTAESANDMTFYSIVGVTTVLALALLLVSVAIHDHARIRCAAAGPAAMRAYMWAIVFVLRREGRALLLMAALCGTGVALWAVYQSFGMLIATDSTFGVTLSLIWGEALLASRMVLRVWFFAAETVLQMRD